MNNVSYMVVFAITAVVLILQLKKYMEVRHTVSKVEDIQVIEKGKTTKYLFVVLAIVFFIASIVLFTVPLQLKEQTSYALLAWVLCVVCIVNALTYTTALCLYFTKKDVYIGDQCIARKKISHVQEENGKPSKLVLIDGTKISISAFQAETLKKANYIKVNRN